MQDFLWELGDFGSHRSEKHTVITISLSLAFLGFLTFMHRAFSPTQLTAVEY